MIVKKMPILQGFPDFESVKNLSKSRLGIDDFRPLFYDIETTGLSRNSTFLYLIGAVVYEENNWQLYQWLAENQQDEPILLKTFSDFARHYTCTIQYNGDSFDQPYLEARCALHHLPAPFEGIPSLDLYRHLKPLKTLLKLPQMKQPDLEQFLGITEREYCDGRECIKLYRTFSRKKDAKAQDTVLGHNQEDLLGLGQIHTLLAYLSLYEGPYEITETRYDGLNLILHLSLPQELPQRFSNGNQDFYITGGGNEARISIKTYEGRLRQYFSNYKDYVYLPNEDMAVPKTLGEFLDRTLRVPATAHNCYNYFKCDEAFLQNRVKQKEFLGRVLPWHLKSL